MKLFKMLFILALAKSFMFGAEVSNESLSNLRAFKDIGAKVNAKQLIGKNLDLYLVKGIDKEGRAFSVITDKDGKYLILTNNVFDVKKQAAIKIPANVAQLKGKELFTFGTGKKEYYVFTDPECPYCHKFEASWEKLKDKVKFKVFFFNLDFHKNANAMSRWILSGKTDEEKAARLSAVGKGNTQYKDLKLSSEEIAKFDKILQDSKQLGMNIGVQGTPAVFDSQGNSVNWTTIK